jgi:hypothetical protein
LGVIDLELGKLLESLELGKALERGYSRAVQGRNLPAELATFKDALCLRYNAAQRLLLFNGKD